MRVIAGKARSLPLKTVPGTDTRPTTDRIKETLFNMLQGRLYGARFLDLFAGSGAIGIEALSRGAAEAVFVEHSRQAAECIRENLKFTHLEENARVLHTEAESALRSLSGSGPFDIIFMDPPYNHLLEKQMLALLSGTDLADADTLILVEASLSTEFDYLSELGYTIKKIKRYKTNMHVFIQKREREKIES